MKRMSVLAAMAMAAGFSWGALPSGVTVETSGDAPWFLQTAVTYDGTSAWQSGDLAAIGADYDVESVLAMTVQGPCTVSFQFGFQGNSSCFNCMLDDDGIDLDYAWSYSSPAWVQNEIIVAGAGEHTLTITCWSWPGSECAQSKYWIANIQRTAAPDGVVVSFDANGGFCATNSWYYPSGTAYGTLPTPYRSQGDFLGWYTAAIGGSRVDEESFVRFDVDQLYAHWGLPIEDALGVGGDVTVESEEDWTTGEPWWYGTVDYSYDGIGCAIAGFDGDDSKSFYVTVDGPGTLSFVARCVNSSLSTYIEKQEGEYSYRNYELTWLYSSYSYGSAQTYSVDGFKVSKSYTGGWVRFDIEVYGTGEQRMEFRGYGQTDSDESYALVDCMSWTPATGAATVQFEYDDGKFLSSRTYGAGATYGSLPEPTRTGYVFAGWCTDEDLLSKVDANDYVPFSGAHLYAKWAKTLALDNESWYEGEMTYTTGDAVYRTDIVTNGCVETEMWGTVYTYAPSYIEFDVTGMGFFSFWLNCAGNAQYVISVDGQQVGQTGYSYWYGSDELALSNWQKQNLTISGTGKHTVRITATGNSYSDSDGILLAKDKAFEKYGNQSTFGAWTDKTKNYGCWITGNLATLQAGYAKDTTPKGRVLHAITTLLTAGENTSVQSLFKGFGYAINYMNLNGSWGDPDFSSAPTGNKIVDTLVTVGEPLVKTALEDLEAIPSTMAEFDLSVDDCAYFDEGVTIDYGDVLYMRAALKGILGFAYWSKAYNVEIDYGQMKKDQQGVALKTVSNEASLKTEAAWTGIEWLAPCDSDSDGKTPLKAVKAGTSVYVYVPHAEGEAISSMMVICENLKAEKSFDGYYYSYEGMEDMSTVALVAELDGAAVFRFDVSKLSNVKIANVNLKRVYGSFMTEDGYYSTGSYWSATSVDTERFVLHQTKIADKIRNASALATAKGYVKEALALWQQADAKVAGRMCDCLHLIEYDTANGEYDKFDVRQVAAMRQNISKAIQSLNDGSVQEYDWIEMMRGAHRTEHYADTFADPLAINVNKLFTGDITRSVLPASASDDYYVPTVYEMDPTVNGLLPETTRSQWGAFLDAKEIERSGLSQCEFEYAENGDGTITLTGIVGTAPKGELVIPDEYDGYEVAGIGEKFLEKTSGITSVTVSEGVTVIGREAFHEISTLASVSLPSTLTRVDEKVFGDCPALTKITVADGNETVKVVNGVLCDFGQGLAVVGVNGITSLTLPKGITRIGKQAFAGSTRIATADLSASELETVAKNAFAGCTALTSVTFPSTLMSVAEEPFLFCSALKKVSFLGEEPEVAGGFYALDEEGAELVSATTYVQQDQGWEGVPGTWQGRPITYVDAVVSVSTGICAGSEGRGTVSGGGEDVKSGTVLTLKATAVKGYFFAGWYYDEEGEEPAEGKNDYRSASFQYVAGYGDVCLHAKFILASEDYCNEIMVPDENEDGVPEGAITVLSGSLPTVTVSGLPAGLTFDKTTCSLVYNAKKMKDGDYAFVISVKNAGGYKYDSVVTFVRGDVEELETRYEFAVGESVEEYADGNVTGLPTGLKCAKTVAEGEPIYTISGVPTKAGRFKAKENGAEYYIMVYGTPSRYVEVSSEGLPAGCKATGSGVYAAGAKVTLKATAAKGLVFAGWYYDADFTSPVECDADYRNPSLTPTDMFQLGDTNYPRFIALKDDFCGEISIDGWEEGDGVPEGKITVESESLPTVTVSGLPAGLTFDKKTGELVFNEAKMKAGDYAFVISAKNAGGYKNDRVVTFGYETEVEEPRYTYQVGQIVCEGLDFTAETANDKLTLSGLPKGLKLVTYYELNDEGAKLPYYTLEGVPTAAGRSLVKASTVIGGEKTDETYYILVDGAPSRYVEVVVEDGSPTGCKVTGSGVYAAGASVKTSATAAKGYVFAAWCAEYEDEEGSVVTEEYYNDYADFLGKDGDPRVAAQTWLQGSYAYEEESTPSLPFVSDQNYARLVARFVSSSEDALDGIAIYASPDCCGMDDDIGEAWNVLIDDGAHTTFGDDVARIAVSVDSVSAPKLTIKGTVAGLTIKNYGTWAELYCDPSSSKKPKSGEYALTFTAQNQSKQTVTRTLTVRVPNQLAVVGGVDVLANLDTSAEGHFALTVGETLEDVYEEDPDQLSLDYLRTDASTLAEAGITISGISVSGLPSGVSCKNGVFSGTPTKAGIYTMTVTATCLYGGKKVTATATAFFRVEAIDSSCVGTFNGGLADWDGNAIGTFSATVSDKGKLTSCKLTDLKGKSTSIALKTQSFFCYDDHYFIAGYDKSGNEHTFEIYPVVDGEDSLGLSGTMLAALGDDGQATARQNVWSDKAYKAEGLLPNFPTKGVTVSYEEDGLSLTFKAKGDVTATRGKKSGSARFELATYDAETGWTGVMTVNVPDGTAAGYCKTFDVTVSSDSKEVTISPESEPYPYAEL